jgi:hypothetical protein
LRKISPDLQLPPHLHLGESSERLTGEHPVPRQDTSVRLFPGIKPDSFREENKGEEGARRAEATLCQGFGLEKSA